MILRSLGFRAEAFNPLHPRDPALMGLFGWGARSAAGVAVTPDTAMRSVAVYACVLVISEALKQTPLLLKTRTGPRSSELADTHPVFPLLESTPNRFQTAAEFKQMLQGHLCLRGRAYAEILATGGTGVAELMPLHPDRVRAFWAPDGKRAYAYSDPNGGQRVILQSEMLHLMGLSLDGLDGLSPIACMRNAIGLDLAQEEFAGANIQNGVRPAGVLQTEKTIGEEGIKGLRKHWEETHAGSRNTGKVAILEDGLKWQQVGLSLEDAEFLDSRKFSITQIARMFRVPPHMIADLDRATFSNIEQQSLEFVQFTMMPWFVTWQDAIRRDLLGPSERRKLFAQFDVQHLVSVDQAALRNMLVAGRQWGWFSANDARARLGENPIDDGDTYLQPVNMADAAAILLRIPPATIPTTSPSTRSKPSFRRP
jgi:HK97 family phage portal protein